MPTNSQALKLPPFVMVPTQLIGVLSAPVFQVYARLAGYGTYKEAEAAYEDCFPAVETLAQALGKSKRPVHECLRKLEDMGLIIGKARVGQTTNYTVRVGGAAVEALLDRPLKTAGVVTSQGVRKTAQGGAENSTPSLRKTAPYLEPDIKNQEEEGAVAPLRSAQRESGMRMSFEEMVTSLAQRPDSQPLANGPRIEINRTDLSGPDLAQMQERYRQGKVKVRTFAHKVLGEVVDLYGPVKGKADLRTWALAQVGSGAVINVLMVALDLRQMGYVSSKAIEIAVSKTARMMPPTVRELPGIDKVHADQEQLQRGEAELRSLASEIQALGGSC